MKWIFVLGIVSSIAACARHVVIEPHLVASHNDPDWEVVREPGAPVVRPSEPSRHPTVPDRTGE